MSSSKVIATSFLYLTVDRWIAGDISIYLKFALKVTHTVRKRRFRQISLNSATAVTANEKNSINTNRKATTHFSSSHTLCVTPKSTKGWLKTRIFTFDVAIHFFVASNRRHFKLSMWVEHSKSKPTDEKTSLKWAWSRHVTHFQFWVPPKISLKRLKLAISNLVCMLITASPSIRTTNCSWKGRGYCHVTSLIFFGKISDNISKTVRNSLIVPVKFQ